MPDILAALALPASKQGYTVAQSEAGDWVARERQSGLERHFTNRKEALHFALFERGASALLAPSPGPWGRRHGR